MFFIRRNYYRRKRPSKGLPYNTFSTHAALVYYHAVTTNRNTRSLTRRRIMQRVVLSLALVAMALVQNPQQPQPLPKELDKYRIENTLPTGAPEQPSQAELEILQKQANKKQK